MLLYAMNLDLLDLDYSYPQFSADSGTMFRLRGVNLHLKKGRITLCTGVPASGKSTLCRILQGIIPSMSGGSFSGSLLLDGHDIHKLSAGERMEYIMTAGQNPEEQIICNRCDEEAAFALESLGLDKSEIKNRLEQAFKITGMTHLKSRQPASLSGGEKKKLLIACVLAVDPRIYILDEALEEIAQDFRISILDYLKKQKKTVFLTSSRLHNEYLSFCSSYAALSDSGLVQDSDLEGVTSVLSECGLILKDLAAPEMPAPGEAFLKTADISFSYSGNSSFSLNIEQFDIKKGECLAFTGDNGSGKTTFAKILSGLLRPSAGKCSLHGKPVSFSSLSRQCGYVFQNPDHQLFLASAQDELKAAGISGKDIIKICGLFGLNEPSFPSAVLSYGTRKKLQASIFYALDREIVILDEADSGLSPLEIIDCIQLFIAKGSAVVLITHDRGLAKLAAHRQFTFSDGSVREVV